MASRNDSFMSALESPPSGVRRTRRNSGLRRDQTDRFPGSRPLLVERASFHVFWPRTHRLPRPLACGKDRVLKWNDFPRIRAHATPESKVKMGAARLRRPSPRSTSALSSRGLAFSCSAARGSSGKIFWVLLLRRYPEVGNIYPPRPQERDKTSDERFWNEIATSEALEPLRDAFTAMGFKAFLKEKIVPIDGDVGLPHCGIDIAARSSRERSTRSSTSPASSTSTRRSTRRSTRMRSARRTSSRSRRRSATRR